MNFHDLYYMSCAMKRGELRLYPDVEPRAFPEQSIATGLEAPRQPIPFRRHMGRRLYDVIGTGFPSIKLYSPRAIECLRPFSGWRGYPVRVVDKSDQAINDYQILAITGRCGPVQYDRSEVRQERLVPEGPIGPIYYGLYFDEDSWDGSDLFLPEGTSYFIVVEQVRKALLDAKITNIQFTRLTEFQRTWER